MAQYTVKDALEELNELRNKLHSRVSQLLSKRKLRRLLIYEKIAGRPLEDPQGVP